ncbi:MAG TPA: site-specific integrase [Solirubrobacteraceae bacterium]|nr:site-specific integrase [Solirubrobacteraceae bacterium]
MIFDERRKNPAFALRFRAFGQRQYVTLGTAEDGWTLERANEELQNVLADVRRGRWQLPKPKPVVEAPDEDRDPTFHVFASEWFEENTGSWSENTRVDYGWQLSSHLLPFFENHRLSQITVREIERYRAAKVREGILAPVSINKTITRLGQILERAVRWEMIDRNPAKLAEKVKAPKPKPVWLDRAEHIAALLDAAGELDRGARKDRQHVARRAMLATLVFGGLRIGEMTALTWRHVDLTAGRIHVRESKTDAGVRQVDMLPALRDELLAWKATARSTGPNDLVFPTSTGQEFGATNLRKRVLAPAVERANELLAEAGEVPLPERLTPHKLRHTFASLLVALGVDPGAVMDQLGHTDPTFTLRVYRHGMRRDQQSKAALREMVGLDDPQLAGPPSEPRSVTRAFSADSRRLSLR